MPFLRFPKMDCLEIFTCLSPPLIVFLKLQPVVVCEAYSTSTRIQNGANDNGEFLILLAPDAFYAFSSPSRMSYMSYRGFIFYGMNILLTTGASGLLVLFINIENHIIFVMHKNPS